MKSVIYTSLQKLGCGCPPVDVILCVDSTKTVGGVGFMSARLIDMTCGNSSCGHTLYSYTFTYDEALLLDPNVDLQSCDITGVFCDGCMVAYVRWLQTSPWVSAEGDDYVYVMPAGPPPIPNGDPLAFDIVNVVGNVVTLAWHSATVTP